MSRTIEAFVSRILHDDTIGSDIINLLLNILKKILKNPENQRYQSIQRGHKLIEDALSITTISALFAMLGFMKKEHQLIIQDVSPSLPLMKQIVQRLQIDHSYIPYLESSFIWNPMPITGSTSSSDTIEYTPSIVNEEETPSNTNIEETPPNSNYEESTLYLAEPPVIMQKLPVVVNSSIQSVVIGSRLFQVNGRPLLNVSYTKAINSFEEASARPCTLKFMVPCPSTECNNQFTWELQSIYQPHGLNKHKLEFKQWNKVKKEAHERISNNMLKDLTTEFDLSNDVSEDDFVSDITNIQENIEKLDRNEIIEILNDDEENHKENHDIEDMISSQSMEESRGRASLVEVLEVENMEIKPCTSANFEENKEIVFEILHDSEKSSDETNQKKKKRIEIESMIDFHHPKPINTTELENLDMNLVDENYDSNESPVSEILKETETALVELDRHLEQQHNAESILLDRIQNDIKNPSISMDSMEIKSDTIEASIDFKNKEIEVHRTSNASTEGSCTPTNVSDSRSNSITLEELGLVEKEITRDGIHSFTEELFKQNRINEAEKVYMLLIAEHLQVLQASNAQINKKLEGIQMLLNSTES